MNRRQSRTDTPELLFEGRGVWLLRPGDVAAEKDDAPPMPLSGPRL